MIELNNLSKKRENVLGVIKGALSGRRQFVTTESPSKMMKNTFYFTSNSFFHFSYFTQAKSNEFSSYLPVKFVNYLKSRLIFNIFYCF